MQAKAKQHLHAIWMTATRAAAEAAFDHFVEAYGAKYDKAVACLVKDREELLAFYDFPAEHWLARSDHESRGECLRHRPPAHHQDQGLPVTTDGADHGLPPVPERTGRWRRLDGPARLTGVVRGVRFVDGEQPIQDAACCPPSTTFDHSRYAPCQVTSIGWRAWPSGRCRRRRWPAWSWRRGSTCCGARA
jgi:putative transposase